MTTRYPDCICGADELEGIEPEDHDLDCPENPGNEEEEADG